MKNEMETAMIELAMDQLNSKSMKENGHPFAVRQITGGRETYKRYDVLSDQEITELKTSGASNRTREKQTGRL